MIINGVGGYGLLAAYIRGSAAQADWLGPKVGTHLAPFLYSSHEPSELSQWLCYDDVVVIVIMIITVVDVMELCYCVLEQSLSDLTYRRNMTNVRRWEKTTSTLSLLVMRLCHSCVFVLIMTSSLYCTRSDAKQ